MRFVGFDGLNYSFNDTPDIISQYDHFLVYQDTEFPMNFRFLLFNGNSLYTKVEGSFNIDVGADYAELNYLSGGFRSPSLYTSHTGVLGWIGIEDKLIYSSEDLFQYSDIIATRNFTLDLTPKVQEIYTLRPIIEEQEDIPTDIFSEMFGILPVLLVVLISFIGIRKGISWLLSIFRKS